MSEQPTVQVNIPAYENWLAQQPGCAAIEKLPRRDNHWLIVTTTRTFSVLEKPGVCIRAIPNEFIQGGAK